VYHRQGTEARLRWFGHLQRQEEDDCVERILEAESADVHAAWTVEQTKTEKDGLTLSSTRRKTWGDLVDVDCGDWRIELTGDKEPAWLTSSLGTHSRKERVAVGLDVQRLLISIKASYCIGIT